jgi:hypothetical protein
LAEDFGNWLRRLVEEIAARWPGRTTEVAALGGATGVLTYLALTAGASPLATLLAAGVAVLAIWAPWRKT